MENEDQIPDKFNDEDKIPYKSFEEEPNKETKNIRGKLWKIISKIDELKWNLVDDYMCTRNVNTL